MRSLVLIATFALTATTFAAVPDKRLEIQDAPTQLDMIVTGQHISEKEKQRWYKARALERECPKCSVSQPFPGDSDFVSG